jgi:hypothetical protein
MRSNKFKNLNAASAQNIALELWSQSARRANAAAKSFSISEMMLADAEFLAGELMAEKANAMLAADRTPAPAKQKTDLCAASLIMAAGVALSGFAFMFAPAGNQAAQVFAVCSLAAFSGLFFLLQSFNSVK